MEKTVIVVMIGARSKHAIKLQEMLTKWGCYIKTRLGIHDGVGNQCSENGLIVLEVVASDDEKKNMLSDLEALEGVNAKMVTLSL